MSRSDVNEGKAVGLPPQADARLECLLSIQRTFASVVNLDGSLTPTAIKALLERYEITIRSVAEQLCISDAHVHAVINGKKRNPRVQDAIAQAIGMDPDTVWGRKAMAS